MKHLSAVLILLSILVAVSCAGQPEPDIEATVAAAIAATQTAAPTNTPPSSTPTPTPTDTPTPTPTDTPTPTPTGTSTPTPMPGPINTPTPIPTDISTPASPIIEAELETGDILYELPEEGFSIALSPDWQIVNLDKAQLTEVFDAVGEQNESLKELFTNKFFQNLAAAGIKFYAINLSQESLLSTVPATINVLKQELPFEPTLDMYVTLNVNQLEQFFDLTSDIKQEQMMLGDVEAVKIAYTANIVDPFGRTIETSNTQYLVINDSLAYVITLSIPVELVDEHLQPFSEAVETFRLVK